MNSKQVYDLAFKGVPINTDTLNTKVRSHEHGCYGIYCKRTKKIYVGSSVYCGERKCVHFGDLKRGRHRVRDMQADFNKYGKDAFSFFIIEKGAYEYIGETEKEWGELLKSKGVMYKQSNRFSRPDQKQMHILRMTYDNMYTPIKYAPTPKPKKEIKGGGITAVTLAELEDVSLSAIEKRFRANFPGRRFERNRELTAAEITMMTQEKYIKLPSNSTDQTNERISDIPTSEIKDTNEAFVSADAVVSNEVPPGKKQDEGKNTADAIAVMIGPIAITALSVCLTITGLYVFCDWAGAMLGGMFSIFLVVAVLVARNYMKGDTSEQALKSVLRLEVGAAGLHCFTFWRLLPQFPDGQWFFYSRCVACAVLAGFAAYLSYSAVVTVRNYNAEI